MLCENNKCKVNGNKTLSCIVNYTQKLVFSWLSVFIIQATDEINQFLELVRIIHYVHIEALF